MSAPNAGDIERSLGEIVTDSGVLDVAAELAEGKLDELLTAGPLKEVPFFSLGLSVWRSGRQIRDWLFVRKLGKFLGPIHALPPGEVDSFREKLGDDPELRRKTGEHLILILDRLDDLRKPELVAKAFLGFLKGSYDFVTFQRLSLAIDRCFYADLFILERGGIDTRYSSVTAMNLAGASLIEVVVIPTIRAKGTSNSYRTTELGETFRTIVLGKH